MLMTDSLVTGCRTWIPLNACRCGGSGRLGLGAEALQQAGPAAVDVLSHLVAALGAELLELAVLELDPRRVGTVGDEADLDLGADRRVRLPLAVDVPAHHEALRRLPHHDLPATRAGPVLGKLVPKTPEMRFHHHALARRLADAVIERPPAAEPRGEHLEGARRACFDPDRLAHRRDRDRLAHGFPLGFSVDCCSPRSTSA